MSTIIPYERLPLETSLEQTETQTSWRGWSWKLLKPQQEFLIGLGKLMGAQAIGYIITGVLGGISSQGDIARELNLHLTDTYYKTCTQVENAFITTMISTGIYFLCTYGYFLKNNREKCDETISSKMQIAIQHRIRDEIQAQLERRRM